MSVTEFIATQEVSARLAERLPGRAEETYTFKKAGKNRRREAKKKSSRTPMAVLILLKTPSD